MSGEVPSSAHSLTRRERPEKSESLVAPPAAHWVRRDIHDVYDCAMMYPITSDIHDVYDCAIMYPITSDMPAPITALVGFTNHSGTEQVLVWPYDNLL